MSCSEGRIEEDPEARHGLGNVNFVLVFAAGIVGATPRGRPGQAQVLPLQGISSAELRGKSICDDRRDCACRREPRLPSEGIPTFKG